MSNKLNGDFDGDFWIENLDSQPHRFKMIPLNDTGIPNHYSTHITNPTLIEHDDRSLTFCLAAKILTGFKIRTRWTMTKSDQLHTYRPENAGTNGEKIINLANLFDDETVMDADGWSMWSRELTFDDINFVNSNGGVTIVYNSKETPNYWFDFSAITTLSEFFDLLSGSVEYIDNT